MAENSNQIVYVLTNPAMVGLVKIGKTSQFEVEERMKQLYGTGVPVPFECAFACQVKDASEVEKALHYAFGKTRINPSREFFRIEPDRVIAVLKLLKVDDITVQFEQQLTKELDAVDKQSGQNLKNTKRPFMNFHALGIPDGSVLVSKDGAMQVTVAGERKVNFEGAVCSLIVPTRKLLNLALDYPIQPSPYWTFNGSTVKEIYEAFHNESNND
ncbi:GIY-YIG nuclease family protein [Glaciimonas sp. GNP009]